MAERLQELGDFKGWGHLKRYIKNVEHFANLFYPCTRGHANLCICTSGVSTVTC